MQESDRRFRESAFRIFERHDGNDFFFLFLFPCDLMAHQRRGVHSPCLVSSMLQTEDGLPVGSAEEDLVKWTANSLYAGTDIVCTIECI